MTGKISLTASMRSNLLSLQNISRQVSATQNKLATGNKVNSAIDNPSSYYTARALNNRADDLNALLDSMGQAVSTIKAATTALETGAAFLEQAAAVATQALETVAIPAKSYFEDQENVAAVVSNWSELKAALDSGKTGDIVIYGNIEAQDTIILKEGQNLVGVGYYGVNEPETDKFSKISLTSDTGINLIEVTGTDITISNLSLQYNTGLRKYQKVINTAENTTINNADIIVNCYEKSSNAADIYGINIGGQNNIISGVTTIRSPNGENQRFMGVHTTEVAPQKPVTIKENSCLNISDTNIAVYCTDINLQNNALLHTGSTNYVFYLANIALKGANAKMIAESGYYLTRNEHEGRPYNQISMKQGSTFISKGTSYVANNDFANVNLAQTINSFTDEFLSHVSSVPAEINFDTIQTPAQNNISERYTSILEQYDSLIKDSTYKGINLLQNERLNVNFNENRSASLNVQGKDMSSAALGLTTLDWQSQEDVVQAVKELTSALKSIRSFSAELGNNYSIITSRQDFTENLINILTEGADKLTLADMNEESANMLALQTRQQLAVNSLSLASQASQSVLRLF